jgi:HD-GYP domain-containing protein (c-di-GMP phosphodiesterase class II)
MTSDRPYRGALSIEEATSRLQAGAGRQWDPIVVNALLTLLADGRLERDGRALASPHGEALVASADGAAAVAGTGPNAADAA